MRAVALLSGGLDSVAYAIIKMHEGYEIYPLYIDYGQLATIKEWESVVRVSKILGFKEPIRISINLRELLPGGIQLMSGSRDGNIVVPARNLLFIVLGGIYANTIGADVVLYGAAMEDIDKFADCTREFAKMVESILNMLGIGVRVLSPVVEGLDTATLLRRAYALSGDILIDGTWSCYLGGGTPCGKCYACRRRSEKLRALKIGDSVWRKQD